MTTDTNHDNNDDDSNISNDDDDRWEQLGWNPFQDSLEMGRREGQERGAATGRYEGYLLGRTTAVEYGMELGFWRGCVPILEQWYLLGGQQQQEQKQQQNQRERIVKLFDDLKRDLQSFPDVDNLLRNVSTSPSTLTPRQQDREELNRGDDPQINVMERMQRIRCRFKVLTQRLGLVGVSLKHALALTASSSSSSPGPLPADTLTASATLPESMVPIANVETITSTYW